jgi:hypothetical protein
MGIKGFKAFDKDLKCRDFQYEVGKIYKEDVTPSCCNRGFHFCEYPLDIFRYYNPSESRFCEVEALGDTDKEDGDTKVATNKIKIGAEITIESLTKASIDFIYKRTKKDNKKSAHKEENSSVASNTGYRSVASNTGYRSVASNTGDRSVASNTGDSSVASNTGYSSVASNTGYRSVASNTGYRGISSSLGIESKSKAKKGNWLVLAEWERDEDYNWAVKCVKTKKVDGKNIKEDTLYQLINGKFVEAEND